VTSLFHLPPSAVLYECQVSHRRRAPVRNAFRYRTCMWLVDVADLPRLGPLASFRAKDHLGHPQLPIEANVRSLASGHGIDLTGGRILMLTTPCVAGLAFNPLTVYWCHTPGNGLACVIAEVHNTYRQRHSYLLTPDDRGHAAAAKEFYVSPFYPVAGSYQMSLPEPGQRLTLSITYRPPSGPEFAAAVTGHSRPATWSAVTAMTLRYPAAGAATAVRIRRQGIALYARGLRPVPRPYAPQGRLR
jgi:uncharacterized protein